MSLWTGGKRSETLVHGNQTAVSIMFLYYTTRRRAGDLNWFTFYF